jgi:hypothetical protein
MKLLSKKPAKWFRAVSVALPVIITGVVVVYLSFAAGPVAFEADGGVLTGAAVKVPDAASSGGSVVKFGSGNGSVNPYGAIDYCALEGTNTVVYGWAADPQASNLGDPKVTITAGTKTVTVSTDQAGFRDSPIDSYITANHPGDPTPGTYGFKANLGVLTKSSAYAIGGTITNVATGANVALGENRSGFSDGVVKPTFQSGYLPSECLGGTPVAITKPCADWAAPPSKYDHVIWIYEENREFDQVIGSSSAPYMTSLGSSCGTSSNFSDFEPCTEISTDCDPYDYHSTIAYPAALAGSSCTYGNGKHGTDCWYSLSGTEKLNLKWKSLFRQVRDAGGTWKEYDESAPGNCSSAADTDLFHAGHNPARYFDDIADQCATRSVTFPGITCTHGATACSTPTGAFVTDVKNGTLPTFSLVIPNVANEMHGIAADHVITNDQWINQGDLWFKTYMNIILSSAEYKKGRTAVFVIWDEPRSSGGKVPFLAISPSVTGGIKTNAMNNFAVLRATERMLGLSQFLGCAMGTPPAAVGAAPPAGSSCFTGPTTDLRALYNM